MRCVSSYTQTLCKIYIFDCVCKYRIHIFFPFSGKFRIFSLFFQKAIRRMSTIAIFVELESQQWLILMTVNKCQITVYQFVCQILREICKNCFIYIIESIITLCIVTGSTPTVIIFSIRSKETECHNAVISGFRLFWVIFRKEPFSCLLAHLSFHLLKHRNIIILTKHICNFNCIINITVPLSYKRNIFFIGKIFTAIDPSRIVSSPYEIFTHIAVKISQFFIQFCFLLWMRLDHIFVTHPYGMCFLGRQAFTVQNTVIINTIDKSFHCIPCNIRLHIGDLLNIK